jgi:hypothetical protein
VFNKDRHTADSITFKNSIEDFSFVDTCRSITFGSAEPVGAHVEELEEG